MCASMRPGRQVKAERSSVCAPAGAETTTVRPSIETMAFVLTLFVAGSMSFPHFTTSGSAASGSESERRKAAHAAAFGIGRTSGRFRMAGL